MFYAEAAQQASPFPPALPPRRAIAAFWPRGNLERGKKKRPPGPDSLVFCFRSKLRAEKALRVGALTSMAKLHPKGVPFHLRNKESVAY